MQSKETSVEDYLKSLPAEKRKEIEPVRRVILKHLPAGFDEIMDYGMISYVVPLKRYPETYNGHPLPIAALAAQKNYNSVYLMGVYGDLATEKWFLKEYEASGKKLDMGKSCVRFKRAEDLPLEVIGKTIARVPVDAYLKKYEAARRKKK